MALGEGWYLDLTNGEAISVDEHALDVAHNPQKFRINPKEIAGLQATSPTAKDQIRRLVLHRGFARVRSHGNSVVVEFDVKLDDALPILIPFLTETFGPHTWVAFHDVANHRQYTDIRVLDLEDQDKLDQVFGAVREHRSIKLHQLYEDVYKKSDENRKSHKRTCL